MCKLIPSQHHKSPCTTRSAHHSTDTIKVTLSQVTLSQKIPYMGLLLLIIDLQQITSDIITLVSCAGPNVQTFVGDDVTNTTMTIFVPGWTGCNMQYITHSPSEHITWYPHQTGLVLTASVSVQFYNFWLLVPWFKLNALPCSVIENCRKWTFGRFHFQTYILSNQIKQSMLCTTQQRFFYLI